MYAERRKNERRSVNVGPMTRERRIDSRRLVMPDLTKRGDRVKLFVGSAFICATVVALFLSKTLMG